MNPLSPPTFQGYFWLPGNTVTKVPGHFHCSDDGTLRLDVLGELVESMLDPDQAEVPRILGVSENGAPITLENCFFRKRNFNFPGLAKSSIHVNSALVGCHLDKDESANFDEVACYSDAINNWLEFAPIEATLASYNPVKASIAFTPPNPREWMLSNAVKMKMRSLWTAPAGNTHREARITQQTWVGFKFPQATSLDELLTVVNRFCNFVSFVVDQALSLNAIEVYSNQCLDEVVGSERRRRIQVYYTPNCLASADLSRISSPFPLFSFTFGCDRFGELISNWLENYDKFDSSFNLYFATKTSRDLYLDNRFLMLAQALESLHRHSSSTTAFSVDDYSSLCKLLEEVVPAKFADWLKPRLAYGNEPSLRLRLKSLFKAFESIYGDSRKVKNLISRTVDTRNYLTHYDVTLRQRSASGADLYKLCLSLETLFQLHMATLCGITEKEVVDLCQRSELFRRKIAEI